LAYLPLLEFAVHAERPEVHSGRRLEAPMKYKIALTHSDEGVSVSVPGLPGCWSQGTTEAEAIENAADAIREYLAVRDELLEHADVREIEVA
jgi:predicted RNase H-like HicB family nuclease